MNKILGCVGILAVGWMAAAGVIDASGESAAAKSCIAELGGLKSGEALEFIGAVVVLSELPSAEALTLMNGKTPQEVVNAVKEKYPEKLNESLVPFRRLTPQQLDIIVTKMKDNLAFAKPEAGLAGFVKNVSATGKIAGNAIMAQNMDAIAAELDDAKLFDFMTAYSVATKKENHNALKVFFTGTPDEFIAKIKELDPKDFAETEAKMKAISVESKSRADAWRLSFKTAVESSFAKLAAKPEEPGEVAWVTDFTAAQKSAAAEQKYLFVLFTGSDWCPWCVKLEKEFLGTKKFAAYVGTKFVPVLVDFPRTKPLSLEQAVANRALSKKYGVTGYPTILLMTADGKVIGKSGYQRNATVDEFIKSVDAQLPAAAPAEAVK